MRIDNSQVVREVDPRTSRDLWWLLLVVMTLVGGIGLYAWPHLEIRETSRAQERMSRERERLLEENRKLVLERASYSNLRRVEAIAVRDLGLAPPPPDRLVVVEKPRALPEGAQLAHELKR
jgi:cell division protein FtsL